MLCEVPQQTNKRCYTSYLQTCANNSKTVPNRAKVTIITDISRSVAFRVYIKPYCATFDTSHWPKCPDSFWYLCLKLHVWRVCGHLYNTPNLTLIVFGHRNRSVSPISSKIGTYIRNRTSLTAVTGRHVQMVFCAYLPNRSTYSISKLGICTYNYSLCAWTVSDGFLRAVSGNTFA